MGEKGENRDSYPILEPDSHLWLAHPCDRTGAFLLPGTLPTLPTPKSNDDWSPFSSRAGFELADLLFKKAELSQRDTDELLSLWSATLVPHDDTPPIANHRNLHAQIDAIKLGSVPWESWTGRYQGHRPKNSAAPNWMNEDYHLWYRDPRKVVHNILLNPDFNTTLDYTPYREFQDRKRRYCDFMSGNWAWDQCVSVPPGKCTSVLTHHFLRISLHQTRKCTVVCLSRSYSVPIKPRSLSPPVKMNITRSIYQLGTSTTTSAGRTRTHWF